MAITPVETVDEFCTGGSKSPFAPSKLVTGYTGSENDPAFAENINDYWGELSQAINQNADVQNNEIIPLVDTIPALTAQVNRNSFPVFTVLPYAGDIADLPADWAACQGQTFNEVTYPLLYAANGNSNVLPDLRTYALIGSSTAVPLNFTNGNVISHSHGAGALATDTAPNHTHGPGNLSTNTAAAHTHGGGSYSAASNGAHTHGAGTLSANSNGNHAHDLNPYTPRYPGVTVGGTFGAGNDGDLTSTNETQTNGAHTHSISGNTGSNGAHTHSISGTSGTGGSHSHTVNAGATAGGGSHSHTLTGTTASDGGPANVPKSATVHFIVRLE